MKLEVSTLKLILTPKEVEALKNELKEVVSTLEEVGTVEEVKNSFPTFLNLVDAVFAAK